MPNRTCDSCGKSRDMSGAKVCENSHFVCKGCVWAGTGGGLLGNELKNCPLCKKALR
jgi:hypothetical protein